MGGHFVAGIVQPPGQAQRLVRRIERGREVTDLPFGLCEKHRIARESSLIAGEQVSDERGSGVHPRVIAGSTLQHHVTENPVPLAQERSGEEPAGERLRLIELTQVHVGLSGPAQVALVPGAGVAGETALDAALIVAPPDLPLARRHRRRPREPPDEQPGDGPCSDAPDDRGPEPPHVARYHAVHGLGAGLRWTVSTEATYHGRCGKQLPWWGCHHRWRRVSCGGDRSCATVATTQIARRSSGRSDRARVRTPWPTRRGAEDPDDRLWSSHHRIRPPDPPRPELAKDVRQQVFLDAFQGIDTFEGRSSLWSWLCGIAYHRCVDELKRIRRAGAVDLDDFDLLDGLVDDRRRHDGCGSSRQTTRAGAVSGKLSVPMRTQLLMRCFFGLSYVEIGEVVGTPHGTVQVHMSRILPRLRRCLRGKGLAR